jgi:hypothetical protein
MPFLSLKFERAEHFLKPGMIDDNYRERTLVQRTWFGLQVSRKKH